MWKHYICIHQKQTWSEPSLCKKNKDESKIWPQRCAWYSSPTDDLGMNYRQTTLYQGVLSGSKDKLKPSLIHVWLLISCIHSVFLTVLWKWLAIALRVLIFLKNYYCQIFLHTVLYGTVSFQIVVLTIYFFLVCFLEHSNT